MDESRPASRIGITTGATPPASSVEYVDMWMGGEASVGTQARRHVQQNERTWPGFALTILGLTFLGGLALGTVASACMRKPTR